MLLRIKLLIKVLKDVRAVGPVGKGLCCRTDQNLKKINLLELTFLGLVLEQLLI
ncbi:hypothetical protein J2S05_003107 [Alkalicoccobacillus murimartini]|uniref:Uncharacterized protein n=1 Tax=Alkalicoccobacillus murimartini TaxID=171685 RepID=A0ABT9YKA2_9BACI|nr:hypothetical protein [Alkalicoccobacillus murimartini]